MIAGIRIRIIDQPRPEAPAGRAAIPIDRALVCPEPDCRAVFPMDGGPCPSCGSRYGWPLASWTERRAKGEVAS